MIEKGKQWPQMCTRTKKEREWLIRLVHFNIKSHKNGHTLYNFQFVHSLAMATSMQTIL